MELILRNYDRYPGDKPQYPKFILVEGTLEQAQLIAEILSNREAGCDYYWYVEEGRET